MYCNNILLQQSEAKTLTQPSHPVVGDEEITGNVEDERVQVPGVEGQCVVIVESIDLDVAQAHLVVGKDGVWVNRTGGDGWYQS